MNRCDWCGAVAAMGGLCAICGAEKGESKGRGEGEYTVQLVGLVRGEKTPFDGEYLQEYDPRRGGPMSAHLVTTPLEDEAMRFADVVAARREWMRWDGTMRPDGQPSRPLSAFNIMTSKIRSRT